MRISFYHSISLAIPPPHLIPTSLFGTCNHRFQRTTFHHPVPTPPLPGPSGLLVRSSFTQPRQTLSYAWFEHFVSSCVVQLAPSFLATINISHSTSPLLFKAAEWILHTNRLHQLFGKRLGYLQRVTPAAAVTVQTAWSVPSLARSTVDRSSSFVHPQLAPHLDFTFARGSAKGGPKRPRLPPSAYRASFPAGQSDFPSLAV